MKNQTKTTGTTTNKSAEKQGCCCGDSCDTKDKNMKEMKPKP
jgi:hypothetical protein